MEPGAIVDRIYDCADAEDGWRGALAALGNHFVADKGHLFVIGARNTVLASQTHGYSDESAITDAYHQHYQKTDPRFQFSLANLGRVACDADLDPSNPFERSLIYNDLLRARDVRYNLFVTAPVSWDLTLAQAFMRPHSGSPFRPEDVRAMESFLPHLGRAIHLRQLLDQTRRDLGDLQRALDLLPIPVAILGTEGRLICASARADAFLQGGHGLVLRQQKVSAIRHRDALALEQGFKLAAAAAHPSAWERGALREPPPVVNIARDEHRPLMILLHPLRPDYSIAEAGGGDVRVLAVFHDPETALRLDPALIERLHGLTPTEAMLAASLAGGRTLAEFAMERGSSEQTARTHLKRILEKTGATRQADLVRLLLSSVALQLSGR